MWKVGVISNEKGHMSPMGKVTKTYFFCFFYVEKIPNFSLSEFILKTTLIKCLPIGENEINVQKGMKKIMFCVLPFYFNSKAELYKKAEQKELFVKI